MFHFVKSSHTTDSAQHILRALFQLAWLLLYGLVSFFFTQTMIAYYNPSLLSHNTSNQGLQNGVKFIPSFLVENHISTRSSTLANMVRTSYPLPGGIGSFAEFWPLECFETERFCDGLKCFLVFTPIWRRCPILTNISQVESNLLLESDQCSMFIHLAVVFVNDGKLRGFPTSVALHIHRFTVIPTWICGCLH